MRRFRPPTLRAAEGPTSAPSLPAVPLGQTAVLPGGISSSQMAVTQEADFWADNFTTTTTGAWVNAAYFDIFIPDGNVAMYITAVANVSHSAANATSNFRINITQDGVGSTEYNVATSTWLSTPIGPNLRIQVALADGSNLAINYPNIKRNREQRVFFDVWNDTTGTLTLHGTDDTGVYGVFAMLTGDVT